MQPQERVIKLMNFQLDAVIEVLLSSDNQRRNVAEKVINELPLNNFDEGIDALLMSMNSPNNDVAQMAALLFKKKYLDVADNFTKISPEKMMAIIQKVQATITTERKLSYLRRCCEILVKIHTHLNQIPEILNIIRTFSGSDNLNIKLSLMYLIEIICEYTFDDKQLVEHSPDLETLFQKGLEDENIEMKTSSFKTLVIFLASIEDENLVKKFEGVLNLILAKCIELVKHDQESGKTAIESLNELIEVHPKFVKPIFGQLLTIFNEIMQADSLDTKLRITSLHGIHLLCHNYEALVRKSEYFKTKTIVTYMKLLSENTTDVKVWAEQLNDEIGTTDNMSAATDEHLFQILSKLGVKFLLPLFIPYIQAALRSSLENQQLAGLTAMATLAEGSKEIFNSDFGNIMSLILPLVNSQSPKVIYGVVKTFGSLCDQFSPMVQVSFGNVVLAEIMRGLKHPLPKIQFKAAQAIQNFCKASEQDQNEKNQEVLAVFSLFLEPILHEIIRMMETNVKSFNFIILSGVLGTLNSVSTFGLPFQKYYHIFMPTLKQILAICGGEDTQKVMIRENTIECIGCLLSSIKQNTALFLSECESIMVSLLSMSESLDKNDPLQRAIFTVYETVVEITKAEFAPYAVRIIDRALYAANITVDCRLVDDADVDTSNKRLVVLKAGSNMDGAKNIVLNTDSLQLKLQGATLLRSMAENMGAAFFPYVQKSLPTVTHNVTFGKSKEFRQEMIAMVKFLVLDCNTPDQRITVLNQVMHPLGNQLSTAIQGHDQQEISLIMEVVCAIMPHMNEQMMLNMPKLLTAVLNATKSIVSEVQKEYAEKDMDDDLQNQMDSEVEQIEEIYSHVEQIIKLAGLRPEFVSLKSIFPSDYEFTTE